MVDAILIIEDEHLLGGELKRHYQDQGWNVEWAVSAAQARYLLFEQQLDPLVVLSDINLPDGNGLDLLDEVRQRGGYDEWVFLTGYGDVPDSVRAMRLGAFEFLTKPCEPDRLDLVINGAARGARAHRRLHEQSDNRSQYYQPQSFAGSSEAAQAVQQLLTKLAAAPFSALFIFGETGTGKGLAARILHHSGARAQGPLVEINCAALPHDLLESELFGHEAGAFTGAKGRRRGLIEQAHGGTLFLDEIGEMPIDLQSKLLKVVEDHKLRRLGAESELEVDVQVLAATNRDPETLISDGRMRADLYHRLSVFKLELPPLRQRVGDLRALVPLFVAEFNACAGKNVSAIGTDVWQRMEAYRWPGNVRELRNVIERCVLLATDQRFPLEWLQLASQPPAASTPAAEDVLQLPLDGSLGLDEMVQQIIEATLARHDCNVVETSRALKTTREKVRYRIEKYNIKV